MRSQTRLRLKVGLVCVAVTILADFVLLLIVFGPLSFSRAASRSAAVLWVARVTVSVGAITLGGVAGKRVGLTKTTLGVRLALGGAAGLGLALVAVPWSRIDLWAVMVCGGAGVYLLMSALEKPRCRRP